MEYLENLLGWYDLPVLSAFILGLMTAISPCPLATNITAIGYISRDIENRRRVFLNGLIYTLGRALSYTALGLVLYFGASKFRLAGFFQSNGEKYLGFLLIITGFLMLDFIHIKFPALGRLNEKFGHKKRPGKWQGALLIGILFALAFCPYSGVLYFGILIPMTISTTSGLYLPAVFAIATGLPVIVIAYLLAFSISGIGNFYNKMKSLEKWFRRAVAISFILAGGYYVFLFYFKN